MCGYLLSVTREKINISKWNKAFLSIKHRGPDSSKVKFYKNALFNLKFGFHRLSIVDHQNKKANQPFESEKSILLFNGEIYNYIFLREKLLKKKIQFRTSSDTEVLLKYLETFGLSKTLQDIDGMWSFVWFLKKKNKIYLSRDQYGQKPLYYYKNNNIFLIASEIKALLTIINKKHFIDEKCAYNYLNYNLIDYNNKTLFSSIKQIQPSYYGILYLNRKLNIKKYCYYKFKKKKNYFAFEKNTKILEKKLTQSTTSKLSSEVKFGILLSGGVDSSIIFSIIKQKIKSNINLFYAQSTDKNSKDNKRIEFLEKYYKLKINRLSLPTNNLLLYKYLKKITYYNDYPLSSINSVGQYLIGLFAKKNKIKFLISGQGADELFYGYLKYYSFYLINLIKQKKIFNFLFEFFFLLKNNFFHQFKFFTIFKYFNYPTKKNFFFKNFFNAQKDFKNFTDLSKRSFKDLNQFSVPTLCHAEDRMYMASGIETRFPYLNKDLQKFSLSLRDNFKISLGYTKYILRKAFEKKLPNAILFQNYKEGFQVCEEGFLINNQSLIRKEILNEKSLIFKHKIIDIKFLKYFDKYTSSNLTRFFYDDNFVFKVIFFEIWINQFQKFLKIDHHD
jgi:asparagine synthase (glutamine-hydrolysing)